LWGRFPICPLFQSPQKHVQDSRSDRSTHSHAECSFRGQALRITRPSLAAAAFRPAAGQSNGRVLIGYAPCRSRNLGTVFRSLATTLSPPLRGQRSRPAPSIPHRKPSQIRSTHGSFAPLGFEAIAGRSQRREPVICADFQRSCDPPGPHSPLGPFEPSGSKRSTGPVTRNSSCRTLDCLLLPGSLSFDHAPDQRSKPAVSRLTNR
jgi:hypothetical protein